MNSHSDNICYTIFVIICYIYYEFVFFIKNNFIFKSIFPLIIPVLFVIYSAIFFFNWRIFVNLNFSFCWWDYWYIRKDELFSTSSYLLNIFIIVFLYTFWSIESFLFFITIVLLFCTIHERVSYKKYNELPIEIDFFVFRPLRFIKKILYYFIIIALIVYCFDPYGLFVFFIPSFIGIILEFKFNPYPKVKYLSYFFPKLIVHLNNILNGIWRTFFKNLKPLELIAHSIVRKRWKEFYKKFKRFWNLIRITVDAKSISVPFV